MSSLYVIEMKNKSNVKVNHTVTKTIAEWLELRLVEFQNIFSALYAWYYHV